MSGGCATICLFIYSELLSVLGTVSVLRANTPCSCPRGTYIPGRDLGINKYIVHTEIMFLYLNNIAWLYFKDIKKYRVQYVIYNR